MKQNQLFPKNGCENAIFFGYRSEGTSIGIYEPNVNPELFLKFVCENAVFLYNVIEGKNCSHKKVKNYFHHFLVKTPFFSAIEVRGSFSSCSLTIEYNLPTGIDRVWTLPRCQGERCAERHAPRGTGERSTNTPDDTPPKRKRGQERGRKGIYDHDGESHALSRVAVNRCWSKKYAPRAGEKGERL